MLPAPDLWTTLYKPLDLFDGTFLEEPLDSYIEWWCSGPPRRMAK